MKISQNLYKFSQKLYGLEQTTKMLLQTVGSVFSHISQHIVKYFQSFLCFSFQLQIKLLNQNETFTNIGYGMGVSSLGSMGWGMG